MLIVGGKVAGKRYFPWQAALYDARNQKFLCGGNLLNERIILTGEYPSFICVASVKHLVRLVDDKSLFFCKLPR
jgi:secreted trypsin-like serine protease